MKGQKKFELIVKYLQRELKISECEAMRRIIKNLEDIPSLSWDIEYSSLQDAMDEYIEHYGIEDPKLKTLWECNYTNDGGQSVSCEVCGCNH